MLSDSSCKRPQAPPRFLAKANARTRSSLLPRKMTERKHLAPSKVVKGRRLEPVEAGHRPRLGGEVCYERDDGDHREKHVARPTHSPRLAQSLDDRGGRITAGAWGDRQHIARTQRGRTRGCVRRRHLAGSVGHRLTPCVWWSGRLRGDRSCRAGLSTTNQRPLQRIIGSATRHVSVEDGLQHQPTLTKARRRTGSGDHFPPPSVGGKHLQAINDTPTTMAMSATLNVGQ